ncbi:MAG: MoaD/ThiS family protein [Dehalococcoidia bacterium]
MRVRIRLFAALAEAAGFREAMLVVPEGATAGSARQAFVAAHPALGGLCARVAIAVNAEYADAQQPLAENDELALIPPVSGG